MIEIKDPALWTARRVGGVWLDGEEGQKLANLAEKVPYQPTCHLEVILTYPEQGIEVRGVSKAAMTEWALRAIYNPTSALAAPVKGERHQALPRGVHGGHCSRGRSQVRRQVRGGKPDAPGGRQVKRVLMLANAEAW